jgi:hypothetical protein
MTIEADLGSSSAVMEIEAIIAPGTSGAVDKPAGARVPSET